jgi:hypothetical protein
VPASPAILRIRRPENMLVVNFLIYCIGSASLC